MWRIDRCEISTLGSRLERHHLYIESGPEGRLANIRLPADCIRKSQIVTLELGQTQNCRSLKLSLFQRTDLIVLRLRTSMAGIFSQ